MRCRGFVNTAMVARGAGFRERGLSLQALSCLLLGHSFRKDKKVQMSNWARPDLNPEQISYAATDAWISRKVSLTLSAFWFPLEGASVDARWLAHPQPAMPQCPKETR